MLRAGLRRRGEEDGLLHTVGGVATARVSSSHHRARGSPSGDPMVYAHTGQLHTGGRRSLSDLQCSLSSFFRRSPCVCAVGACVMSSAVGKRQPARTAGQAPIDPDLCLARRRTNGLVVAPGEV
jgi:hypothetical protein